MRISIAPTVQSPGRHQHRPAGRCLRHGRRLTLGASLAADRQEATQPPAQWA